MENVRKIVDVLDEVGGLCQSSGVKLLIEMLSFSCFFDGADPKSCFRSKISEDLKMMIMLMNVIMKKYRKADEEREN